MADSFLQFEPSSIGWWIADLEIEESATHKSLKAPFRNRRPDPSTGSPDEDGGTLSKSVSPVNHFADFVFKFPGSHNIWCWLSCSSLPDDSFQDERKDAESPGRKETYMSSALLLCDSASSRLCVSEFLIRSPGSSLDLLVGLDWCFNLNSTRSRD